MKDQEIDERSIGVVTVGIDGFWPRLRLATSLLFTGQATFGILPENFIEEGERPDGTTCIYRADRNTYYTDDDGEDHIIKSASPEELMAPQADDDHVCIGDPPDFSLGNERRAYKAMPDSSID